MSWEIGCDWQREILVKYRSLMYKCCLLEYRYLDDDGEMQRWYDIHPLIQEISEFKEAVAKLS
jgi:hypothetical protein